MGLASRATERLRAVGGRFAGASAEPESTPRDYYLALNTLLTRGPVEGPLTHAELRVSSQNGEDGVIREIARRLGITDPGTFVEFGTEAGYENNCALLADVFGWSGLFIEADPDSFTALQRKYGAKPHVKTVNSFVTPENVQRLFEDAGVPPEPDVVSIDIDSNDYWVWEALTDHRPKLVVIEFNSSLEGSKVQPPTHPGWDGTSYFGASLEALEKLGTEKGYRLVHTEIAGANAFFVRTDLGGDWPAEPNRSGPNYYLRSKSHPPDPENRPWVDPHA